MTNFPTRAIDPLGQSAIELGLEQASQMAALEEITLQLDELTQQRLKRLSRSLSLSIKTIIESAINYTYAYITEGQPLPDDLQTPKGDFPFTLILSLETVRKLENLGMSQSISECAIIGIQLLYERLIPQSLAAHD